MAREESRRANLRAALGQRVILGDGAMATMLMAKGVLPHRCFEELNLSLAALVRDVHREYMRVGAEVITTNTFGANRARLSQFGFGNQVKQINQAGVRIAREATSGEAWIAGSVGPLGSVVEPWGPISASEARAMFREQISALDSAGADLILFETFQDFAELQEAVEAARESGSDIVLAAQVTVGEDGRLPDGSTPEEIGQRLDKLPVDIVGLNCGTGPRSLLNALEPMARQTPKFISAMPTAGLPSGSMTYPCSPDYMGRMARRMVEAGANLIGGCCGTTAEHIAEMRYAIRDLRLTERTAQPTEIVAASPMTPVPLAKRSQLGAKLAARESVRIVELGAPSDRDLAAIAAAGAIVAIRDTPHAGLSAAAASHVASKATEPVLVLAPGGGPGNISRAVADAYALGIRNILFTGSSALIAARITKELNTGRDLGGHARETRTAIVAGVETDADGVEAAAHAGVDFVASTLSEISKLDAFAAKATEHGIPALITLRPAADASDAEYAANELSLEPVDEPAILISRTRETAAGVRILAARDQLKVALSFD